MRKFLLFTICYLLLAAPAIAQQQDFTSKLTSTYTISPEGITTVSHNIQLTNNLARVYAKQYQLTVGSTRLKNFKAVSPSGQVNTQITTTDNTTDIKLNFTQPVVGKDKTLRFTISYINLDIASKNGRVLEVNIPKLNNSGNLDELNVIINVPSSFDNPSIISPKTTDISTVNGRQIIRYRKNQLNRKGISILFGNHQVYNFTLRYTLKNSAVTPGYTDIAIPPDTAYQKMYYQSITPEPESINVDNDGNWLARYTIKPQVTTEIVAVGKVKLFLTPRTNAVNWGISNYSTRADKFWPSQDPQINLLASQLKTPKNIYNYIVDNLTYNYNRLDAATGSRLGAKAALEDPENAICTEFTDLFVAMARSAGIPARSVDGFAFTNNSKLRPLSLRLDILHAWPEYYQNATGRWTPVDPTWGNTTGGIDYFSRWDLNHFTFAIHGQNSSAPFPAGAYKLASTVGKDVNVAFSLEEPTANQNIQVELTKAPNLLSSRAIFTIYNRSNVSISIPEYNIKVLPPFASANISLKSKPKQLITLTINDQKFQFNLNQHQLGSTQTLSTIAASGLGAVAALIAYKTGGLLVHKQKQKHPLHRQSQKLKK